MTESVTQTPLVSRRFPNTRWHMLRRVLMNAYIALVGAYGLNVTLLLVVRAAVGERWNIIGLMNSYLHLLILPAAVFLPLSLILRRRWLVIELAAPFLFFMSTYGGQFLPRTANVPAEAPRLKVLTFNVLRDNVHSEDVIRIIRDANADIVSIQELSPWMANAFKEQLTTLYPFQDLFPQDDYSGQGVMSRYPTSEEEYWKGGQGFMRLILQVDNKPITLFNPHPAIPNFGIRGFNTVTRSDGINELLRRADLETNPTLIVGDLNTTDLTDDYANITARYKDTYKEVGWGLGFSYPIFSVINARFAFLPPVARIDYIFHDNHFQPVDMRVLSTSGGSDHFPVFATFALVNAE